VVLKRSRTQTIFVMFSSGAGPNDTSGPAETRYYSSVDDGVYYLYQYVLTLPLNAVLGFSNCTHEGSTMTATVLITWISP